MNANIIDIFLRNAGAQPEAIAFVEGSRTIGYGALADDVVRVAGNLRARGLGRGDHVLIFVPMSVGLYTLLLALFHIGAVPFFVDAWSDRTRLAHACRVVEPRGFIGIARAHLLRLTSSEIRRIPIALIASGILGRKRKRGAEREEVPATVSGSDPALITFTTGSSGAPKGAVRTHRFLVAQHEALRESFGTSRGDIDLPLLPIFALNNLAAGAATVIPALDPRRVDAFDPDAIIAQITTHRVATTTGSPSFYRRLAEHCRENRIALPTLRRIFLGGAPVGPDLARLLVTTFPDTAVTIVYGSTEAEPVSHIDARAMLARIADGREGLPVGRPIDAIDLLIVPVVDGAIDVSSEEELRALALPAGESGEICVAGDHVLTEYRGDPAAWRRTKIDAGGRLWHRMGDGGYLDDDGCLNLMGPVRQSYVRNGRRIFIAPIELRLATIDGVRLATILEVGGRVVVVIEPAGDADRPAIERAVRDAGIDCDEIIVVDEIPRDPRHRSKIDYGRMGGRIGSRE